MKLKILVLFNLKNWLDDESDNTISIFNFLLRNIIFLYEKIIKNFIKFTFINNMKKLN